MADWRGRGGGRKGGQPTLSFEGGPGRGGGRAGGQPTLEIEGGPGRGGGRAGSQPTLEIRGGPGRGGGRSGAQPQLGERVDFGGSSSTRRSSSRSSGATSTPRGGSSMGSRSSGERSPRVADPEGAYIFALEIDGVEVAHFRECSGLKSTTEVFELVEGGQNHRVHKLPGQSRWDNIVLRYGVSGDTTLLQWRDEVLQDSFALRRNGSIVMKTLAMEEVRRYNFIQAWPVSWEGPSFNSGSSEVAIEALELAHHGIQVT